MFSNLFISPRPKESSVEDEETVRFSQKLEDNRSPTYIPVGTFESYNDTYKDALMLRPVTLTPQNTDGSSRSHLVVQFKIPLTEEPTDQWYNDPTQYTKLSIVDLAGSEDYSNVNPNDWSRQMASVGLVVPDTERIRQNEQIRSESNDINNSLEELGKYLGYINRVHMAKLSQSKKPEPFTVREELVRIMLRLGVIGHNGLTTLVTTFKSGSNTDADDPNIVLREADRTLGKIIEYNLVPSDKVLDKLRE